MDQLNLPDDQMEKLRQFTEITNMDDWQMARATLESLNWNVERAIEAHLMPSAAEDGPEIVEMDQSENNQVSRPPPSRHGRRRSRVEVDQEFDNQIGEDEPEPQSRYALRNRGSRGTHSNGGSARDQPLDLRTHRTRNALGEAGQSVQSSSSSIASRSSNSRSRQPIQLDSDDDAMMVQDDDDDEFYDADSNDIQADVRRTTTRRGIESALIPDNQENVSEALQNFVSVFQARHCTSTIASAFMPTFNTQPLHEAVRLAFDRTNIADRRPLALYINHEASIAKNIFVSQALCTDAVSSLLRHQYVLWPWDVTSDRNRQKLMQWTMGVGMQDAQMVIDRTALDGHENFPIIVVVIKEKGRFSVVNVIQGMDSVDTVMTKLMTGVESYEMVRSQEEADKREREEREEIRNTQQAEYEASVAADKARIEAQRKEKEQQWLEQERQRIAEEKEMQRRADLAASVPSEPEATEKNVINVKFRLPEGDQKMRRFRNSETVQTLVHYLSSLGFHPEGFKYFNSDFPKKEINSTFDLSKTFADTKWPAREQVFVEEI